MDVPTIIKTRPHERTNERGIELSEAKFPVQKVRKSEVPKSKIKESTNYMIQGAQALLSTFASGGAVGLHQLTQNEQKDCTLVMLEKWLKGVGVMKNYIKNLAADNAAWSILETALIQFIGLVKSNA